MGVEEHLATGDAATAAGRWDEARAAYEAALAEGPAPLAILALSNVAWWSGRVEEGFELLEQAFGALLDGDFRQEAALCAVWLAIAQHKTFGNRVAHRAWIEQADRVLQGSDAGPVRGWVELGRAMAGGDPQTAISHAARALECGRDLQDRDLEICAQAVLGAETVRAGRVDDGFTLLEEAMGGVVSGAWGQLDTLATTSCCLLTACEAVTDIERAQAWLRAIERPLRTYGSPLLHADCRSHLGGLLLASGDWLGAERELTEAMAVAPQPTDCYSEAAVKLATLRVRQGRLEEAEEIVLALAGDPRGLVVHAELCCERGELQTAGQLLERFLRRVDAGDPVAGPAMALLVEVELRRGNLDRARDVVEQLHVLDARHPGSSSVRTHTLLATARTAASDGDTDRAVVVLESVLAEVRQGSAPYEVAVARLLLASVLSGTGSELAKLEAQQALRTFEMLGARRRADEAAALLRALGASRRPGPRDLGLLTGREREVLELLGLGLSNPEVAARLYISPKTVSHHVSNLLAKLGLRNRAEAAAFATANKLVSGHPDAASDRLV